MKKHDVVYYEGQPFRIRTLPRLTPKGVKLQIAGSKGYKVVDVKEIRERNFTDWFAIEMGVRQESI
jgi:hypothetical protein